MDKTIIESLKNKLLEEKNLLEEELSSFAHKDPEARGGWESNFPSFGEHKSEQDENADEVAEYSNELPMEHALETKLQNIDLALKKIENGKYGICESCGDQIEQARLEAEPSARTHVHCNNN